MNKPNMCLDTNNCCAWDELIAICLNVLRILPEHVETRLLNFWSYRGGGKTTFLRNLRTALVAPDIAIIGLWDTSSSGIERIIDEILKGVEGSSQTRKVVLLDNLDHLLYTDDGNEFFKFERYLVLPLLERDDVLLIMTSQIPVLPWREYDVRIHQDNHPIRALHIEEVAQLAEEWAIDAQWLFTQSLGYPQVLCWLAQDLQLSERELAQRVTDHFLADLPPTARELANLASLLPTFDVAVLRDVLATQNQEVYEDFYIGYIERIRELMVVGLVTWDMHMGAYHFSNSIVRHLLARSFRILQQEAFTRAHQGAMAYFQDEARRAGYLRYVFVSAIYHMMYSQSAVVGGDAGESCKQWVQDNLLAWSGADWPAILQTWETSNSDEMVKNELQISLGSKAFAEITQLLETQNSMEVVK